MNKISEIQIAPIKQTNGLVGFTSFVYDDSFFLGGIGIYTRPNGGYRLTYPTRKIVTKTEARSLGIYYPINKLISAQIEEAIIEKFEKIIGISTQEKNENKINKDQIKLIKNTAWGFNEDLWEKFLDAFNINELKDLDANEYHEAIQYIKTINNIIEQNEDMFCSKD